MLTRTLIPRIGNYGPLDRQYWWTTIEFKQATPAPPVQSVTTPQPFLQQPQAPQTGGIPVTGGGPLGSGILPEANLPAGTPPVDWTCTRRKTNTNRTSYGWYKCSTYTSR